MAQKVTIGFKLTENSQGWMRALQNPNMWAEYKKQALVKLTEGAKTVIQQYAAGLWKNPTGQLDNSWFTRFDLASSTSAIYNSKSYAYFLNYGVRRHQMEYLLSDKERTYMAWGKYPYTARIPIPIKQASGEIAFRRPSTKDMIAGKWWHPGFKALHFAEKGMQEYQSTRMKKDLGGLMAEVMRGMR